MKAIYLALCIGMASARVFAEAPNKVIPLFPDAPPPPQIAEALTPYCCTVAGRLMLANPESDNSKRLIEGVACEAKTSDGPLQAGTVCY